MEISIILLLLLIILALAGGGIAGYFLCEYNQRKLAGGRTVAELIAECDEYKLYRNEVNSHIRTSAELFAGMAAQYREMYNHLVSGATRLCDTEQLQGSIETLRAGLLGTVPEVVEALDIDLTGADNDATAPVGNATPGATTSAPATAAAGEAAPASAAEKSTGRKYDDLLNSVPTFVSTGAAAAKPVTPVSAAPAPTAPEPTAPEPAAPESAEQEQAVEEMFDSETDEDFSDLAEELAREEPERKQSA
ncbi:MAG: DUF1043 family protein [Gammaproteobacteria bacterium]|nr:DUF1043 family protein [Gammaproteobacteria bacterium]